MTFWEHCRHYRQNEKFVNILIENSKEPIGMFRQIKLDDKVTALYNVNDLKGAVINVSFHRLLKQTDKENHTLRIVKQFVINRDIFTSFQCQRIEKNIHTSLMVTVNSCNETEE